jgi:hypothetical protein
MRLHARYSLICVAALLLLAALSPAADVPAGAEYTLKLDVVSDGYDGKTCWFHPRAGAIPGREPVVVLTMQKWKLTASDLFLPIASQESSDLGKTWSKTVEHTEALGRRTEPDNVLVGVCDFTPKWHTKSGTLLGTGHTVRYTGDKLIAERPRETAWSVYDPAKKTWSAWKVMDMPKEAKFWNAGAGSTQRVDLPDGDILLPIYFKAKDTKVYSTTVVRCRFDGKELKYVEHGSELSVNIDRGLYEPSLAALGDRYFLTLRNDRAAYVAASKDGLKFDAPRKWTFDDGTDLGSYNTQAHWVTHADGLFLVYTRRGANNDNVMRHRAPLFMARVDPKKLVVLKKTERELVPNKGAQLGNFAVVDVSNAETWVTTSEGMGPLAKSKEFEKAGANGRVYAARLQWTKPNTAWDKH